MAIDNDISFVKAILPDHYVVKESSNPGSIYCKSETGIPEVKGDLHWNTVFSAIKSHFGDRFQEVFHNTCTNHVDFTIYLKQAM